MDGRKSKKSVRIAATLRQGHSRAAYCPRSRKLSRRNLPESDKGGVCDHCEGLLDLRDIFNSFVHAGRDLKRHRTGYPKPKDASYRNIKQQNEYLLKTIFDGKGNYLYHRDCIRCAFDIGTQRLARLRKVIQEQSSCPFVKVAKEKIHRYSDVVLPKGYENPASTWLRSQSEGATVTCCNRPELHG